jgi:hypothetical protein
MNPATLEIMKSVLKTDPSVTADERERLLALLRPGQKTASDFRPERLLKRKQVADMLSSSPRLVDKLSSEGLLHKVKYPGRVRAAGYRLSEVQAIIAEGYGGADAHAS